jgi:hypothetical protein
MIEQKEINIQNNMKKIINKNHNKSINNKDNNKEKYFEDEEEPLLNEGNNITIKNQKEFMNREEPKEILFYKRRTKYPKSLKPFSGFILTFFYFIFFSTLTTICIQKSKIIFPMNDKSQKIFTVLIITLWILGIISILLLIDVFTSDPGQQRGYQISKDKFINSRIKKIVKGQKYYLKYCDTCKIIRDLRTFHCKICGICVEKHDHHCDRVSNCIGVYNYKKFFIFVISSLFYLFLISGICFYFFNLFNKVEPKGIWIFLCLLAVVIIGSISFLGTMVLFFSNMQTILYNITVRESIKHKRYKAYDRGFKENCKEALFRNKMIEI